MSAVRFWDWLVIYLCIGGIIGTLNFAMAQKAFRDHPFRHAMSPQKMLFESIVWNMLTWPKIVFLWWAIGFIKLVGVFSNRPSKPRNPDENTKKDGTPKA